MKRRSQLLVLSFTATLISFVCATGAAAQPSAAAEHRVPRTPQAVRVDGLLDEPLWERALPLELKYETNPGDNVPAPAETVCLFVYDDRNLYVGCRASDPEPRKIRARFTDRDRAFQDDFVGIVIDTFNDGRRAFEFFVNPLGVQMDLVQDDVNGSEDSSWDTIWNSAGKITESGYTVEMAIPFSSLRFQRGDGEQTWGLDIVRVYPRDRRYRIGLNRLERDVSCYLCQAAKISGFEGAQPGKNLEINPTMTATRSESIESFPDGGLDAGDTDYDPGLDVRWGFTPNMTLNGTLNPDFSQVEADAARLDVNEQFALFFPEKRPFFLEGGDYFDTPINAVYTRTVADPEWGAKVTGKEGAHALGFFAAEDEQTNLLLPGSQGSSLTDLTGNTLAGVFRYRRDLGRSSAIGGIVTAREAELEEYRNYVYGLDTTLRPTETDTVRIQLLASETEYPVGVRTQFERFPGELDGKLTDSALSVNYNHNEERWLARLSYRDFGEHFRADLGFVPQVDYSQLIVGGEYRWYGEGEKWYSRITWGGDWDETKEQDGTLIEREIESWAWASGPSQSFMLFGVGTRTRTFNGVDFDQNFQNAFFEISPTKDLYFRLDTGRSDRVDFAYAPAPGMARQGRGFDFSPGLRYNLGRHLKTDLSHDYRELELDGGRGKLFKANLTELRLVYQFNVRAFLRLITQYSSVEFDPALYEPGNRPPDSDENLFNQLLFSYKLNPRTAMFVGYTDSRRNNFDDPLAGFVETDTLTQTDRTFFVKLGYAWVP